MKQRHELSIPNGKIIVKEEKGKNLSGPFSGMNVDVKTTRLLDMAARLRSEAIRVYRIDNRTKKKDR
jgi:hypothetical protein